MKKIFTTLLITLLITPFLSYSQTAGTTCSNPIPLYPQAGCGNTSGAQYSGYYQMENAAGNMVPMTGTSTVNPGCTTDNETTQAVEWLEVTATATSFTITNESNYIGGSGATAEKRDYIVYSGTCGSLTQIACFSEVAGSGGASVVTGLTVGQTYLIMVSQSSSAITACATCTGVATCITSSVAFVPPNDICSGAFSLTTNVPFETTNANSTATAADGPAICQTPLSGSVENNVWFSWCAPSTWPVGQPAFLNVNSQICNSTQGLQLSVFGANQTCAQIAAGTGTSVICANPGVTTNYSYTFTPSANNCYFINIDGFAGTACTFLIQVGTSTVVCTPPTIAVNSAAICGSGSTTLTATGATSYTWSPATGLSSTTGASVVANPTVTTVYTILGSASGCTGTNSSTVSITPTPTITPAGTNTLCNGSSTSLSVSGASTYTWSPSTTLSASTGSVVTATPTANTTYTIIGTSAVGGCTNSAVYSVSVTPTPTVSVNSSTICSGLSTVLTASGATTYSWSPGTNLSATSGTTVSASPTTTTVYTVTGTTNGCSGTNTSTVTVNATPTISVNSSTICSIASTTLTASGGTTYSWTPGTNLSATSGTTVSANPTTTTVYTVTGTTNGCSGTNTSTVTVNSTPTITVNSPTICSGTSTVLTASGGTTYSWTPGTNLSATSGTTVTSNPTTTTVYTVTGTTNGCSGTNTSTVTVRATPTITVNSPTICSGTSTVLTASGGTTYSWTPGTNLSATSGTTVTSNPTTTTIYTVTGTTNGCSASNTSTVTVNSIPTTIASTSGTLTCTSLSVNLNSTLAGVSYTWTAPAGGLVSSANTQSTSASGAAGIYTLNTQSAAGCTYSTTTTVTQNTIAPTGVSAGLSQTLTCSSPSVNLIGTVITPTNATVNWTGPSVCGTATTLATSACGAGIYTLTATNPLNGCTATSTVQVSPSAGAPTVTNNPVTNTITCTNTLVTVSISTTVTPVTYTWTGTGIVGTTTLSSISVSQGGTFQYTVTNTSSGCSTSNNQVVIQNTTVPTTTASTSGSLTCSSTSTVGLSSTLSGMNYTWTAPSGGSVATANSQTTSATGAAGVYTLNVVNPTTGCTFSTTTSVSQNTAVPTTTASTSGSLTCSSSSTVGLSSTLSGMNYTWTAPAGGSVTSANSQNTSASGAAGVYTLNVFDSTTGCSFTTTTSVSQNTTVPTSTANTTGTITCTTSTVSLSASLAGMNYTWTAPSSGSVGSANSQNTSATGVGTYTLTVEDPSNSCTYTTTSTVTDNTVVPTGVSAGSNQTLTCSSTSITLSGSVSAPSNALLDWGTSVCGTQTTATTTACAAGVYTLTATDPLNGCTATSTVEVFPNAGAPTPSITATALTLDCNNSVQSVTVTSTPSTDITYTWNNTPSTVSTDGSVASFTDANTYICTVTNTLSNCSTPIQVVVTTNTTVPTITITINQTLTCATPTAAISLTTTPTSGLTYTWTGTVVSGQGTDVITVNAPDIYTVTVTDAANGCTNTASAQVDADANVPVASITATSSNSVITCQNPTVTLTTGVTPLATYSYTWLPSGGNAVTANVTSADSYTVVVLNSTTGCSTTAFYTVTSNTTSPSITANDVVIPCGSPSVALTASSSATNSTFGWTTGTGTILSPSTSATVVAGSVGQYIVTGTDVDNGCSNTATVNVTTTGVNAAFTANPTSGTAPLSVNFTNQSTGASTYSWTFGDDNNNTSSSTDPNHVYNAIGNYTVVLVATDASGLCSSTATISIEVLENASIIIPNVFTPNGDGSNDFFKIKTTGIKDLNVDIFNRWGLKVFTIGSINDSWDGGNSVDGTYFFILKATGYDGKTFDEKGYISLFR